MSYDKKLAEMVQKSGKSLREIADACKAYYVKIDPSYISKLQTGKQPPASEEVTIAIAKVCNGNPEELLYEGYMDKAPEIIKEFNSKLLTYFREITKSVLSSQMPEEVLSFIGEQIDNMPDYGLIKQILSEETTLKIRGPIYSVKNHEDQNVEMIIPELFSIDVPDDSMHPLIPKGSKVQIDTPDKITDGDIAVVKFPDETFTLRRLLRIEDKVILVSENSSTKPLTLKQDQITVVGKVKSVTLSL